MKRPIWFKAKRYGYGWYPATWQGWLIIAVYVLLLVTDFLRIESLHPTDADAVMLWVPNVILLTVVLIAISWLTGEKPGWHWGNKKK